MSRRLSFLLCLLVVLTILCSSCVFAESTDYPWGMNEASVIRKMGKKGEEDTLSSPGNLLLRYYGQHVSIFEANLVYAFRNDALFARMYGIEEEPSKSYTYLGEALSIKYGISAEDTAVAQDALKVLGLDVNKTTLEAVRNLGNIKYKTWTPSDNTNIVLVYVQTDEKQLTALFYIQPSNIIPNKQYNFDGL